MVYTQADYNSGVYVLQIWAGEAGVDRPSVIQNFKSTYGDESVKMLGKAFHGVMISELKKKFREALDDGASALNPPRSVLSTALLQAGSVEPSAFSLISDGISDSVKQVENVAGQAFSGLKWVAIAAAIAGAAYLAYELGFLKKLVPKRG